MFQQHGNVTQFSMTFLFIGWLILGAPAAAFGADDADARGLRPAGQGSATATIDDSELDEPPPATEGDDEDSELDEPPPDPLAAGPRWWQAILNGLGSLLGF